MLNSSSGRASAVRWITNGDCSDACSVDWRDWSRFIPESPMAEHPKRATKVCPVCGRPFQWRKKWKDVWEEVRYCSERCRRRRSSVVNPHGVAPS